MTSDPIRDDYLALSSEYKALEEEKSSIISALKNLKLRLYAAVDKKKIHEVMKQLTDS